MSTRLTVTMTATATVVVTLVTAAIAHLAIVTAVVIARCC